MVQLLQMVNQNSKYNNTVRKLPRNKDGTSVRVGLPSENRTLCIHYIKLIVTEKKPQMVKILSDFGNKTREQKRVLIFVYCTHTHTHI